jgi:hypothetical protein
VDMHATDLVGINGITRVLSGVNYASDILCESNTSDGHAMAQAV